MTRRVLYFVYGCGSYLVFLGVFLYAIAFVGGLGVPTRLDGPARGPLVQALAIDTALLALFAVQHSVMARPWFKARWTRLVPSELERSTFVLFASVARASCAGSGGRLAASCGRWRRRRPARWCGRSLPPAGRRSLP